MQTKGTIENGWWWVHPRLAAPGVFAQVLYPSNTNVDQAIVWLIRCFTSNAGLCLNAAWMLMVVLSAVIANRCLTLLGISRAIAGAVGILFALSPYALYEQPLFCLAIYLLPIPCTAALLIATNRFEVLRRGQRIALLIGSAMVGFNYTYYAFFSCFLLVVATLVAYSRDWHLRALRHGAGVIALICVATAINLAPSWYAWQTLGKPVAIPEKHAAESDQYGLKIRYLVSPVYDHWFPPFENWNAREQAELFLDEGEPRISRLGLVATVGFALLLAALFTARVARIVSDGPLLLNGSRLALAAVLLGTVGGFGSLFNLFVSPEIRAYSRLSPFIAFFSLVAIGLVAERWHGAVTKGNRLVMASLCLAFGLGIYDQSRASAPLNALKDGIQSEWQNLSVFVQALEQRLPSDAMVFQLPVVTFLNEIGRERMLPFDHIKQYVVSQHLHWSYPALTDSVVDWQQRVGRLPPKLMAAALAEQQFSAIVVDRYGYADNAVEILNQLGVGEASEAILVNTDRYVALDVRRLPTGDVEAASLPRLGVTGPATLGVSECDGRTAHYLEWIGDESAMLARRPVRVSLNGDISVSGWAVDQPHQQLASAVDVVVDDQPVPALYGIDRPDVARALGLSGYRASGFTARLRGRRIGFGLHVVSLRILAADGRCFYQGPPIPVSAR